MPRAAFALPSPWARALYAARLLLSGAGASLAIFHVWLFASQAGRGELADPALALRWIVAGGLVAALALLWRRGESLGGRQAVAVWALAALLHAPVLADAASGALATPSLPEAITSVLQITAAAGLGVLLLASLIARRRRPAPAFIRVSRARVALRLADRPFGSSLAPRPPPRA